MVAIQDLEKFVAVFCKWPKGPHLKRYAVFLRQFHRYVGDALTFLGRVGEGQKAGARAVIFRLSKEWAWNVDVDDFMVEVDWGYRGGDLFKRTWATLPTLVGELERRVHARPVTDSGREMWALLLSQLMPIYFVNAGNISPALELLDSSLPDFVLRACGPQQDCGAMKTAPTRWDDAYDACRGFLPSHVAGVHNLALIYNPEAELVAPRRLQQQQQALKTLGALARDRRAAHSSIGDLERFVASYCAWPKGPHLKRYAVFIRNFNKYLEAALNLLERLGGGQQAAARRVIFRLRHEWAWNNDVADFSVTVDWHDRGDDIFRAVWSTLVEIIHEMSRRLRRLPSLNRQLAAPAREFYALLLSQLLPIYFVKAGNISAVLAVIDEMLPNLVVKACGEQRDVGAFKRPPTSWKSAYDSCRGFEPACIGDVQCLVLIYNPEADAVLPRLLQAQTRKQRELRRRDLEVPLLRPVINFVWFGTGAPNPANTGFANAVAYNLNDVSVRYWCLQQMITQFRGKLSDAVEIRSIEGLLGQVRDTWGVPFRTKVDTILAFYQANRGYAPAKDLITYLALAFHGGYFFDANCQIEDWRQFEQQMRPRPFPAFLRQSDTFYFSTLAANAMSAEELLAGMSFEQFDTNLSFQKTDMWAMYAPSTGNAFEVAARAYVAAAEVLGLAKTADFELDQVTARQRFINGNWFQKRAIAGALGIRAIFAAMHSCEALPGYAQETANWKTNSTGEESYEVPELGLTKKHGGSW